MGVQPRDRDIMDPHICIVPSTHPYFVRVVEIDDVKLFLTLVVLLRRVDLKRFYHDVVFSRLVNFKNLMCSVPVSIVVF